MRSETDTGVHGLQRSPLSSVVSVSSREVRENNRRPDSEESFIASMRAALDGCRSLGTVLEPHFPLVLGRTQGAGSLIKTPRPSDSWSVQGGALPRGLGTAMDRAIHSLQAGLSLAS